MWLKRRIMFNPLKKPSHCGGEVLYTSMMMSPILAVTHKQENGIKGLRQHMRGLAGVRVLVSGGPLSGTGLTPACPLRTRRMGAMGIRVSWSPGPLAPRRPQACQARAGARGHHFGHTASVPRCLSCGWPPRPSSSLLIAPPLLRMPPPPTSPDLGSDLGCTLGRCFQSPFPLPFWWFWGSSSGTPGISPSPGPTVGMCRDPQGAAPVASLMRKPVLWWNV